MVDFIRELGLELLPGEGGYFKRVYPLESESSVLDSSFSIIYYCIDGNSHSSLHRLSSDEIWTFFGGGSAEQLRLFPDGSCELLRLGSDIRAGEVFQTVVPAGVWQATRTLGVEQSLFSCTVIPAYEDAQYTHGRYEDLISCYPERETLIRRFISPDQLER